MMARKTAMTNPIVGPVVVDKSQGQDDRYPPKWTDTPGACRFWRSLTDEFEVARVVHSRPALDADHRQGQTVHRSLLLVPRQARCDGTLATMR